MKLHKSIFISLILFAASGLLFVYKNLNPLQHDFFPKCPINHLTGLQCPGCGNQRLLHHLLNGEIKAAFFQNPLTFFLVPYVLLGLYLNFTPKPTLRELKLRKVLFGFRAIQLLAVVIISYTILRNTI